MNIPDALRDAIRRDLDLVMDADEVTEAVCAVIDSYMERVERLSIMDVHANLNAADAAVGTPVLSVFRWLPSPREGAT